MLAKLFSCQPRRRLNCRYTVLGSSANFLTIFTAHEGVSSCSHQSMKICAWDCDRKCIVRGIWYVKEGLKECTGTILKYFVISTHLRPAFIIIFDFIMISVIVVAITAIDAHIHCSRLLIFKSYYRPSHWEVAPVGEN